MIYMYMSIHPHDISKMIQWYYLYQVQNDSTTTSTQYQYHC